MGISAPFSAARADFRYDAAGNQTRAQRPDGSWVRYVYDAAGRLSAVTDDKDVYTPVVEYTYGTDRHRLGWRIYSGPLAGHAGVFVWDGDHNIARYGQDSKGKISWANSTVFLGGRVLAEFSPGSSSSQFYLHHPDRLGTRRITDSTGTNVVDQVKLPFGCVPRQPGSFRNPIFTSYDRSSVTGLDYAVNRWYDADTRFTQPDPLEMRAVDPANPQSLNLYSYARNDPANNIDPSGLQPVGEDLAIEAGQVGGLWGSGWGLWNMSTGNYSSGLKDTGSGLIALGFASYMGGVGLELLPILDIAALQGLVLKDMSQGLIPALTQVLGSQPGSLGARMAAIDRATSAGCAPLLLARTVSA